MIPTHMWGAAQHAYRGRPLWAPCLAPWAILDRAGDAPEGLREVPESETTRALTADPPPDAWTGTAGQLGALLAPVVGEHCDACNDRGEIPCTCCGGAGRISCGTAGCPTEHPCDCRDGEIECGCQSWREDVAVIRGGRYAARTLLPLRGLLHVVGGDTECRAWVTPLALANGVRSDVLLVAVAGYRYALSPVRESSGDVLHEVPL